MTIDECWGRSKAGGIDGFFYEFRDQVPFWSGYKYPAWGHSTADYAIWGMGSEIPDYNRVSRYVFKDKPRSTSSAHFFTAVPVEAYLFEGG